MEQEREIMHFLRKFLCFFLIIGLIFGTLVLIDRLDQGRYNVTHFGANGSDTKSDSAAIQKCLDQASVRLNRMSMVYIPSGTYYLTKPLQIYSNTILTLDEDTVMVRTGTCRTMLKTVATEALGYGQQHDIFIQGGLWDGNPYGAYPETTPITDSTEIIKLRHGENITLQNMDLRNNTGAAHLVEILGCQHVTIDHCTFGGHRNTGGESEAYKEAIQIDYCWSDREDGTSFTGDAYPYDNTVCQDITVSNCTFFDYMVGVGQHFNYSQGDEGRCRDIVIQDNQFIGMDFAAVHLYTMDDVVIKGNSFLNCATGVLVWWSNAAIYHNTFSRCQDWDVKAEGTSPNQPSESNLLMFDNQMTGSSSFDERTTLYETGRFHH